MHNGTRQSPRTRPVHLLVVGLMLSSGCISLEDPFEQWDGMVQIPPWLLPDAGQVLPGADSGLPLPSDAQAPLDAAPLADAAAPLVDADVGDAATSPLDGSAPGMDAQAPEADAQAPDGDAQGPEADGQAPAMDAETPAADAQTPAADAQTDAADAQTPVADAQPPGDAQTEPPGSDVCATWSAERADLREGTWSGSTTTCNVGELSSEGVGNALRLFNLYRGLVGLNALAPNADANRRAQACALLMAANGTITHTPPSSWKCYSAEAAATAGSSSIATAPAVAAVDLYVLDSGNTLTLGHRRWVFSNYLAGVGFGSASRFSCQYQPTLQSTSGAGSAKPWVAWPAGRVPFQVFNQPTGSLDRIGWSIQSDSISLLAARVAVTRAGSALPVSVNTLPTGYGSRYAIRIVPQGWTTEAGATYEVSVTGTSTPINYVVEPVNCTR